MDNMTHNNVTIRASSLGGLFDCPARWEAIHIENRRMPSSGKAVLGQAVHASTAAYDQSSIDGIGLSIDDTAAAAVDTIFKREDDVDWSDTNQSDAEKIALSLHDKYCKQVAPKQEYLAVEVECENLEISDIGITLTGTTDRIKTHGGQNSIVDIKTGKTVVAVDGSVKTHGHAYQLGVYELLAKHATGLDITAPAQIIGLNTAKTENSQRIGSGEVVGAMETLLGDQDTPGVLQQAADVIHSGLFFGNPRSMLCGKKYCPIFNQCKFRR